MVVFCPNDGNCNHPPTTPNKCVVPPTGVDHWEGPEITQSPHSCTFSTGFDFAWSINANAQQSPNFSEVGTGFNGHDFVIRKDGKHVMFTDINNNQCKSIYYALDLKLNAAYL